MSKTLVIVESPAKAKTISKYLGSDYIVKSSVGHIRDLPKGKSKKPTQRNTIPKDLPEDEKKQKLADPSVRKSLEENAASPEALLRRDLTRQLANKAWELAERGEQNYS